MNKLVISLVLTACNFFALQVLCYGGEAGPLTIGGVNYEHVDPGEPFVEAPRPPQNWKPPQPTAAEKAAGMIAYVTIDPGDYKPDRIPRQQEHVKDLSAFLTQGEYEPVWLGVYGLEDLRGIKLTVDVAEAPFEVEVRYMHFWPQRTRWWNRKWYMTPELLLPCRDGKKTVPTNGGVLEERPFELQAGGTAAFWLTLKTNSKAHGGTYQATVNISSEGRPTLTLPLKVEILPFELRRPKNRNWLIYCDAEMNTGRGMLPVWELMTDEQLRLLLRDFAEHGITGLVDVPLKIDISDMRSGKVNVDASDLRRIVALSQQVGLDGPFVCRPNTHLWKIRDAIGVNCDPAQGQWPAALKSGVTAVARAAAAETADIPCRWFYQGADERNSSHTWAIQDFQCWRAGGVNTYATSGDLGYIAQARIDAPCFHPGAFDTEEKSQSVQDFCAKTGREFWWYGTGSYVNPVLQEAQMFSNRYGAGYLFWKTNAKAQVSWTFYRAQEDPFNDFDGIRDNKGEPKDAATAYLHLQRPRDWSTYQGTIPTIAWESLREGVDDYKYLYTLSTVIARAQASGSPTVRNAATRAKRSMDALLSRIPWGSPIAADPATGFPCDVRLMQQVRRAIADLILELEARLTGDEAPRASLPQAEVTLEIRVTELDSPRATLLPKLHVLPAQSPPKIDGVLNDPCWQEASVASGFRYIASGHKAKPQTYARMSYDENALYVAFDCRELVMSKLVANQHGHDASAYLDDCIELFVAGGTGGNYVHVAANANASIYDALCLDRTGWDASIEASVVKEDGGWTIEMALPWKDLNRAGIIKSSRMSVNFCRSRPAGGVEQYSAWSFMPDTFHDPQHFGNALLQGAPEPAKLPMQIPGSVWFVRSTQPTEIPFNVNIDSREGLCSKIYVQAETSGEPLIVELPAKPGEKKIVNLEIRGSTTLRTSLLDASGKSVGPTIRHMIFACP